MGEQTDESVSWKAFIRGTACLLIAAAAAALACDIDYTSRNTQRPISLGGNFGL